MYYAKSAIQTTKPHIRIEDRDGEIIAIKFYMAWDFTLSDNENLDHPMHVRAWENVQDLVNAANGS